MTKDTLDPNIGVASLMAKSKIRQGLKELAYVGIAVIFATTALAQHDNESEVPARETKAAIQTEKAAEQAKARRPLETKEEVTYEDILKDPDNINLNFRFAKSQVKKGNLRGAASTLERILLINPTLTQVRAFYGIVLFRLDNITEAEREFTAARKLKIPAGLRSEIDGYLHEIKIRRRHTRLSVRETVGFGIDSNRNAAPSSKQRFLGNSRIDLPASERKNADTSFLNVTGIDVSHDLGFQAGHKLIGSFNYFRLEQTEVNSLDLSSFDGEAGVALKSRSFNLTPTFFVSHTKLSGETFMRSQGGALMIDREIFKRLTLFASGRLARQDFTDITENLAAHERRGNQADATVGMAYRLTPAMSISSHYTVIDKDAKEEYQAYGGHNVGLGHSWLLGKGQFLLNAIEFERDNYEAPDRALVGRHRRDKTLRIRTTYGAPLSFVIDEPISFVTGKKILPRFVKDFVLTFTFEQFRSLSNVTNYTYSNSKFLLALSQKWEF